ncbi:EthD domain-containing protein [Myxococcota bacterium]|nr:EthD domain-containing protein [Myxococcota bacterium]
MEKITTLLWRPENQSPQEFCDVLLQRIAPRLRELGALKLKICAEDNAVAEGQSLRMTPVGPPKSAFVSYWIELAQDRGPIEAVLSEASASLTSFLVVESSPIVNTKHVAAPGERTPGFSQVTCVTAKQDIPYEEFIRIWQEEQRPCAIETQSTFQYVRNEIVRVLTGTPPDWSAIVEEGFPIGALSDPHVFYDAVGDQKKFDANLKRMMDTVERFLQMDATDVTAMSEYVFER